MLLSSPRHENTVKNKTFKELSLRRTVFQLLRETSSCNENTKKEKINLLLNIVICYLKIPLSEFLKSGYFTSFSNETKDMHFDRIIRCLRDI